MIQPTAAVRADWLSRAVISGFIASSVMLFAFGVAYVVASSLGTLQLSRRSGAGAFHIWLQNLTNNPITDLAANSLYVAIGLFLAGGLAWAIIYALWFEPYLTGPAWLRGALYAFIPGVLSQLIVMPLVGGGLAGFALGAGPLPALGALLLHLVYGITLGVVYGPLGDLDVDTLRAPTPEEVGEQATQNGAAIGICAGALVGAAIGLLLGLLGPFLHMTVQPAALALGGAILLSALGGLIGSFADLTPVRARRPRRPSWLAYDPTGQEWPRS